MHRYLCFFLLLFSFLSIAQTNDEIIRVGYAGSAPFVIEGENEEGIVFDIWKEIAFDLNLKYTLQEYASVEAGIEAAKNNEIAILLGPTTINEERAEEISFSQPYYNTEMAILAPVQELTVWEKVSPIFSKTFLFAVLGLLLILTVVGFLFWLVEGRKFKEDYGERIHQGIGSGIWLAIVTMTTVGYGDYSPRTPAGRVVMGSWMILSLILATSFVAGIATTLSLTAREDKTITSIQQLDGKKVAVPDYKKIMDRVRNVDGQPIAVKTVSEGYKLLLEKKVDALIYDEIPLEYIFSDKEKDHYVLSKKKIEPQYYGFVFPIGSNLKRKVDLEIIHLQDTKEISHIVEDWISRN
ncbi:transporter substrate-binding domain-containing protein [Aequorivita marisscotiae]|uniref:Transporter substrate-binding domain-containing protein n=1 Tax=Aequorivita marisscotiae TaxID=3040348 RepID=A0ABY8KYN1_9FLAO|nr:transporter substrate-binding domain-containing protein [Aequorivita sp. Ant34-E75]WGF93170.1 transporter substrate-binding domain-containing protein [Aequorivita sp. Ant34-E75]